MRLKPILLALAFLLFDTITLPHIVPVIGTAADGLIAHGYNDALVQNNVILWPLLIVPLLWLIPALLIAYALLDALSATCTYCWTIVAYKAYQKRYLHRYRVGDQYSYAFVSPEAFADPEPDTNQEYDYASDLPSGR